MQRANPAKREQLGARRHSAPDSARRAIGLDDTGPGVARAFHTALALVTLIAWLSLAAQLDVLCSSTGLLPALRTMRFVAERHIDFWSAPTLFHFVAPTDAVLTGGVWLGVLLASAAVLGVHARWALGLMVPLYLSYVVVGQSFMAFQWDNLLLECLMLGACLPRTRPSTLPPLMLKVLLFKLYFESGIAKYQSFLGDWQDGSAMTAYYETAPIPTALAWYAHHLPERWHYFESWFTLVWELGVPFLIVGPRRARLAAAVLFTAFQLVNMATANYGFFTTLAVALHLLLLRDEDVDSAARWVRRRTARLRRRWPVLRRLHARWRAQKITESRASHLDPSPKRLRATHLASVGGCVFYVALSTNQALSQFSRETPRVESLDRVHAALQPLRVVNNYHLFGHITRRRVEPELQSLTGGKWTPHHFRFKPGPLDRSPPFVAPHQPRVDFLLWFHGLGFRRSTPDYVVALVDHACQAGTTIDSLFTHPLPTHPEAVRMVYYHYRFTTPEERSASGNIWKRSLVVEGPALRCERAAL